MTFAQLRITYQSDEQMARALFDELETHRLTVQLEQALRRRAELQLASYQRTELGRAA